MRNNYKISETFQSSEKDRKKSYLAVLAGIIKAERKNKKGGVQI